MNLRLRQAGLAVIAACSGFGAPAIVAAAPAPSGDGGDAGIQVLSLLPGVDMLIVEGLNLVVASGPQGVVVVNPGPEHSSAAVLAAISRISREPIRFVIDTSADLELVGGNAQLAAAGQSLMQNPLGRPRAEAIDAHLGQYAPIIARDKVVEQLVAAPGANLPMWAVPNELYTRSQYNFTLNGQAISVIWMPAAHSAGDSVVRLQRSDVVVAGAIFDATRFPVIDLEHGGSIQGEITALNRLLNELSFAPVPVVEDTGGTLVVPIRGPVGDQADVLTYREMVGAIRDRIQALIVQGKSLAQIEAADPAQGYKARYGAETGSWTTHDFIVAVYKSLLAERKHGHGGKT
jgi:glyoxylase-like metal-dependent hydrolase (beta-lactamase superfamily II)